MVEEVVTPEVTPAISPAPSPVEVAPSPVIEPSVTPAVEPAEAVPADVAGTAPAPETVAKAADTLLGGDKVITPVKADGEASPAKEGDTVPAEAPVEAPAEELPTYEPFQLPENVAFEPEKLSEFTNTLAEFERTTKASHEEVQKFGQSLVNRHIAEVQSTLERYTESLTAAWNKQKTDWKDSFLKSPEFANRTDTVVNSAIDAIGVYAGDSTQQDEFRSLMESTGVGNHPAMIRLLSNIMQAKPEPKQLAAPMVGGGEKMSKVSKMYGKKAG